INGQFTGGVGATFELDVVTAAAPAALVAEGSVASPVALAFGTADLPHAATVDTTMSYYEVTGLTSGDSYDVIASGMSDDVDLYVYLSDSSYGSDDCASAGLGDETCTVTATGTSMWIAISGQFTGGVGATFELDVVTAAPPIALVAEGSDASPVALAFGTADLPRAATVDTTMSYYEVTGLTMGTSYTASVTGVSDDVDLYVYLTDSSYGASTWDCRPYSIGTVDEACTGMVATGTSMWVAVDGLYSQGGASFTLDVQ
ncbi:MAG: hypothetical protein KAU21_04910, partial [Gammaproteobacteria bacterium]|nr:hypothetical protein [Gammaproteobacteria bacterium]